jgi:hypothetical protein
VHSDPPLFCCVSGAIQQPAEETPILVEGLKCMRQGLKKLRKKAQF